MAMITVVAGKGTPGVTTCAVGLAAMWPGPVVLADCDPAGGDVALRLRAADGGALRTDAGVVALAARLRQATAGMPGTGGLRPADVQIAAGGLHVLAGVAGPAQSSTLGPAWGAMAAAVSATTDVDVIADCGRYAPGFPAEPMLAAADLIVVVCRADVEGLAHLRQALNGLARRTSTAAGRPRLAVLAVAEQSAREVGGLQPEVSAALTSAGLSTPVLTVLPHDPNGAGGLAGRPARRLDRAPLVCALRDLAHRLHHDTTREDAAPDPNPHAEQPPPVPPDAGRCGLPGTGATLPEDALLDAAALSTSSTGLGMG